MHTIKNERTVSCAEGILSLNFPFRINCFLFYLPHTLVYYVEGDNNNKEKKSSIEATQ